MLKYFENQRLVKTKLVDYIEGKIDNQTFWNEYQSNPLFLKKISKVALRKRFGYIDERSIANKKEEGIEFFGLVGLQNSIDRYLTAKRIHHTIGQKELLLFRKWYDTIPYFVQEMASIYFFLEKTYGNETHSKKFYRDALLKTFRCEKYPPRWLQFCQWPYDGDEPCVFLYQDGFPNKHDFINYHFRKTDGSEIIVSQYD